MQSAASLRAEIGGECFLVGYFWFTMHFAFSNSTVRAFEANTLICTPDVFDFAIDLRGSSLRPVEHRRK